MPFFPLLRSGALSIALWCLLNGGSYAQTDKSAEASADKISILIANAATKLGGPSKIGVTNVVMNWSDNPEIKTVSSYSADQRAAALMAVIDDLKIDEDEIFPDVEHNSNELVVSIITRIISLSHLESLVSSGKNDIILKDYLDGEIADLKMTLNGSINYGLYLKARAERENKRSDLILVDAGVVKQLLLFKMHETEIILPVAHKTTMIAFFETCAQNSDLCQKL